MNTVFITLWVIWLCSVLVWPLIILYTLNMMFPEIAINFISWFGLLLVFRGIHYLRRSKGFTTKEEYGE